MSLTSQARRLYGRNRMAAKWVLAVRHLRATGRWILDRDTPHPQWRAAA